MIEDEYRELLQSVAPSENARVFLVGKNSAAALVYEKMKPGREYTVNDMSVITGKGYRGAAQGLDDLLAAGLVEREKIDCGQGGKMLIWRRE